MTVKRPDRRVERTRRLLQGALIALVQEKGFEALTVQDIIDRADVGRATFYAHFENKEDLLVSGLGDFRASIRERQRDLLREAPTTGEAAFLFSREVFAHASAHRDVFRAMVGKHSGGVVQRLFQRILVELVREELRAMRARGGDRSMPSEAVAQYIAAGLWGLLSWWLDARRPLSVDEVDALFRQLAIPSIQAR